MLLQKRSLMNIFVYHMMMALSGVLFSEKCNPKCIKLMKHCDEM